MSMNILPFEPENLLLIVQI